MCHYFCNSVFNLSATCTWRVVPNSDASNSNLTAFTQIHRLFSIAVLCSTVTNTRLMAEVKMAAEISYTHVI